MTAPKAARPAPVDPTELAPNEDPTARTFTIGQVLSIAVGNAEAHQIFCSWGEYLDIVGYLLSDVPLLEELPDRVDDEAQPAVIDQYPGLAGVEPPPVLASNTEVLAWLAEQEEAHGERLTLRPIGDPHDAPAARPEADDG
jgi:hypothetical protein